MLFSLKTDVICVSKYRIKRTNGLKRQKDDGDKDPKRETLNKRER